MYSTNKYFNAEKGENLLFVLVRIVAILVSIYFIIILKSNFYNGVSISLISVAILQLIVGFTVFVISPKDIIRVNELFKKNKTKIQTEEISRIKVVMKNFVFYRWIEIILAIIGVILYFIFEKSSIFKGIGLRLFIQSIFNSFLDYFAENKGKIYLNYLSSIQI